MGNISHVGTARPDTVVSLAWRATESLQMGTETACERHVVDEIAVAASHLDLHLYVARHRGRASATFDDAAHAGELDTVERAHAKLARSMLRDDVDRLAAVDDESVNANTIAEVDALPIDEPKGVQTRGQRATAGMGSQGGMRRHSAKIEGDPKRSEGRVSQKVAVEGVEHHGRVDPIERAGLDHFDLSAAAFLGRRSEQNDLAAHRTGDPRGGDECACCGSGDKVVSTGMSDPGQGVVLGDNGDPWTPTGSGTRPQGRRHAADAPFDSMPLGRDELANPSARLVLLEPQLRIGVDSPRQEHEVFSTNVHSVVDRGRDFVGQRHGWGRGGPTLPWAHAMNVSLASALVIVVLSGCRDQARIASDPPSSLPPVSASARPTGFAAEKVTAEDHAMGTHLAYAAFTTREVDAQHVRAAFDAATAEIRRLEKLMTTWNPTSEVSRVNAAAGKEPVTVSDETFAVIRESIHASEMSGGAFDITFETLHGLWKFDEDLDPHPPSAADISARLKYLGYRHVKVDAGARTVFLDEAHVRIGLGGIAKGYAVDRAANLLALAGVASFYVQAGGDLYTRGDKPDGSPWLAGIRDPRGPEGDYFAVAPVSDHAFSTAGDYERGYVVDGKRYHHIIDPHTGYPATASRSVTIWAPTALIADEIDDAVFILGAERGIALVESLDDVGAVVVDANNKVWASKRLKEKLRIVHPPTDAP
jgi:thiamine biosynthesis lipoprotein